MKNVQHLYLSGKCKTELHWESVSYKSVFLRVGLVLMGTWSEKEWMILWWELDLGRSGLYCPIVQLGELGREAAGRGRAEGAGWGPLGETLAPSHSGRQKLGAMRSRLDRSFAAGCSVCTLIHSELQADLGLCKASGSRISIPGSTAMCSWRWLILVPFPNFPLPDFST